MARKTRGGRREGAGRPRELSDPVRLDLLLERAQRDRLDALAESLGLPSRAHAVRHLIDAVEL